jgi:hypothetical protein
MISGMSLDIQAGQIITGSFDIMSKKEDIATAIISGATYTAANTKAVMTAGASVGSIAAGSLNPQPKIRRIQLQLANNLRARPVVGSLYSEEFGEGRFEVTGTVEAYMESNALYQEVLSHTKSNLSLTLGQVTNEKYTILIPGVQWLDGSRQIGGNDDDVIVSIPFRGVYDASETASLKITRAVA